MRGAGADRRRWSIPTRSRRRCATRRIQGNCVDFCSRLAPECAVPWRTVPSCLLPSEQEFRRELFRRDTADRPEALVQGRVTDEAGRRIEGAKISVWFQGTAIAEEVSGKDGSFHLRLRTGPWTYSVRVSRAGAGDRDRRAAHRQAGDDRAQLPAGARERHPRARRQRQGRADRGRHHPRRPQRRRSGRLGRGAERRRRHVRARRARRQALLPARVEVRLAARDAEVDGRPRRPRASASSWRAPASSRGAWSTPTGTGRPNATVVALLSAGLGATALADHLDRRQRRQVRAGPLPGRHVLPVGAPRRDAGVPAREDRDQRPGAGRRDRAASCRTRARACAAASRCAAGAPVEPETRAVLFGRSPLALPRKAVGEIDRDGKFVGRRAAARALRDLGARRLAHPADHRAARARSRSRSSPGATVDLAETIVVRPQAEE